jgi:KAP family P-loop domain
VGRDNSQRILLDSPTGQPALGFGNIARALARIIQQSEPRFAIGIFGGWGSGKTTLMKAIRESLTSDSTVIVDFNAWRFEREPQLLVPLLDTVRAALIRWSEPKELPTRQRVRAVATRIGRVVRALASGLSAEVGLPGAATVSYDVSVALDALSPPGEPESAQSLYVAAFQELQRAFEEFTESGVTRVVVFVDDLDRCLPGNALDVLESMKLFFDLPGFVFVVGLDEDVVERAIRAKFSESGDVTSLTAGASPAAAARRLGREYVKKIFQVPYSLPAMVPQQLDDLLASMYREAKLSKNQLEDLQQRVRPYLEYVAVERRVNPREVKRFINAYILQTLIRPELDRDTVLALQTLAFRYEWAPLYGAIFADSAAFVDALTTFRTESDHAFEELSADLADLPDDLARFLRSDRAECLLRRDSLDEYLSSLESTRTTAKGNTSIAAINSLRWHLREMLDGGPIAAEALISTSDEARKVLAAERRRVGTSGMPSEVFELWRSLEEAQVQLQRGPAEEEVAEIANDLLAMASPAYRGLRAWEDL